MIPKPSPAIPIEEDRSLQFLQEWKDLFEKVDPKIKVYIFKDDNSTGDKNFLENTENSLVRFEIGKIPFTNQELLSIYVN